MGVESAHLQTGTVTSKQRSATLQLCSSSVDVVKWTCARCVKVCIGQTNRSTHHTLTILFVIFEYSKNNENFFCNLNCDHALALAVEAAGARLVY